MSGSGLPWWLNVKDSACNAGDMGSFSGSGRSHGEGNGNPLQYSCLKNPMDRGVWRATVHRVQRVRHDWVTEQAHTMTGSWNTMRLQVIRTRPGGWHKELKQGISQVSGRSEGIQLHRFWNLHWRKHRRETARETRLCSMECCLYPQPHTPTSRSSSGAPWVLHSLLDTSLPSGKLSPDRKSSPWLSLDHITCLVMTLLPDSTLVLLGLLGTLDFSSCAHHSWDEPPVPSSLGFTYIPCMSCSLTLILYQLCLRAGLVAYCMCMAMKKEATKITLKFKEQWCSH